MERAGPEGKPLVLCEAVKLVTVVEGRFTEHGICCTFFCQLVCFLLLVFCPLDTAVLMTLTAVVNQWYTNR